MLDAPVMVEQNNGEERLARIEQMIEALQRESAVLKTMAAKMIDVVQASPLIATAPVLHAPTPNARKR
jgi:hypothetical protein